jgi:hypothetical protein
MFANDVCAFGSDLAEDDWRKEIVDYLENPSRKVSRKLRYKAIKFVLLDGRLYYKSLDGVLLQCLGPEEAKKNDECSARWAVWSISFGLPNEMGYQAHWMLFANDAGRLL